MEATNVWNLIDISKGQVKQMLTSNPHYNAFATANALFICPSCPNTGLVISENNYRSNVGGSTPFAGAQKTGGTPVYDPNICLLPKATRQAATAPSPTARKGFEPATSPTACRKRRSFRAPTKGSGIDVGAEAPTKFDIVGIGSGQQRGRHSHRHAVQSMP